MGCGNEVSDWDREAVKDSIAGKNTRPDPKILEETRPAVEAAIEQRCMDLLRENMENARRDFHAKITQSGRTFTPLEIFDMEVEPSNREYQENFIIAQEIGMKNYQIVNNPVILAVKDELSRERLNDSNNFVREALIALKESKLPAEFKDQEVVDKIVFFDVQKISRRGGPIMGSVFKAPILKDNIRLSRTAHIFRDGTGKLPHGKQAHWAMVHELCHLNLAKRNELTGMPGKFERIFLDNSEEWESACRAQIKGPGRVSDYSMEALLKTGYYHSDFIAEVVAAWDTGNVVKICPELDKFFRDHLSDIS